MISLKVKSKYLGFLSKINIKNLDRGLELLDKGLKQFSNIIDSFSKSMDLVTKEFSSDIGKSNERAEFEAKKNKENLSKLFGSSNSNVKIWSDRKIKLM